MPALSESLKFVVATTSTINIYHPNTTTDMMIYYSDPVKGDGYYGASNGLHTVTYTCDSTFVGTVTMQATLATSPSDGDWFDIKDTAKVYSELNPPDFTTVEYLNFVGNFVWVRGKVNISAGSLQSINYNH